MKKDGQRELYNMIKRKGIKKVVKSAAKGDRKSASSERSISEEWGAHERVGGT